MPQLTIALAQLNPVMGDIGGNADRLRRVRNDAAAHGVGLVLTTELYLSAYPPEDLVRKPGFMAAIHAEVENLARDTADGGPAILLGTPWREGGKLYNACLLLMDGKVAAKTFKHDLPNYGTFDEKRLFDAGPLPHPMEFKGIKFGVLICEDMWTLAVAGHLRDHGADILLVPNGSPYESGKSEERVRLASDRVGETGLPLVYLNQVGGQDELVFDGASFVLNAQKTICARFKYFDEDIALMHLILNEKSLSLDVGHQADPPNSESADYQALLLGLRDYVGKNGFPGVVLGLSGGIDSALSAVLAVDALGSDRVWTVMLPSPYTSGESLADSQALIGNLGCRYDSIAIEPCMHAFGSCLEPFFAGSEPDATEENIQSRSRGLLLMALSNKFGAMVVSTGNKSEMAVGYATLYGDMCGGYAVLKDIYKTRLYQVARWRNANRPPQALGPEGKVIPENILTRAPTAELRPGQTDQDSLPPYDVLDAILERLIEGEQGVDEIVAAAHDRDTVVRVAAMLNRAEYKRRQAPPGAKITRRNFGRDRRYPITNRFRQT